MLKFKVATFTFCKKCNDDDENCFTYGIKIEKNKILPKNGLRIEGGTEQARRISVPIQLRDLQCSEMKKLRNNQIHSIPFYI